MTAHERAINAINRRLEQLRTDLLATSGETSRRFLFQSLLVTVGLGEALNEYIETVGQHARRRHGGLKEANETLGAQHADLLKSGQALLERLKADPSDRAIRKEIEATQKRMESIQKTLRRGADTLQRDLAPSLAVIDRFADSIRRFSEADQLPALKRMVKALVGQVRELYATLPTLPARNLIDAEAWEKSADAEIEEALEFYDAYARAGYQGWIAVRLAAMAVSENPPQTADEATRQANESVARRLKEIAGRFTAA